MESTNSKQIPEDEIDLRSIWNKVNSLIRYPFQLFLRNKGITFSFVVSAVLLCIALKYIVPRSYSSSFIIRPNDSKEHFHVRLISDIQQLLKFKDTETIASELKVSDSLASKLLRITTYNPSLKNNPDSTNYTEVMIVSSDHKAFLPLQTALLNYLENNPHFLKIKNLQAEQVRISLEQVERDLVQLDSLKVLQLKNYGLERISSPGALLLNEVINPTAIYSMSIDRLNKKTSLLAQLAFLNNFQLIKSCVLIKQHTFPPRILVMCGYVLPVFLVICFLFLAFKESRKPV